MNKKYLSVILFSALMLGTAGTFTSCKDYDDDIKSLQDQINQKASIEDLNAKVTQLETAVAEAKTAAEEAKADAQEALTKAKEALSGTTDGVTKEELEQAVAAAEAKLQAEMEKLAKMEDVNAEIAALKTELEGKIGGAVSDEELNALNTKVEELSVKVMSIIGHRLTSLSLIPTEHVNGIAAITLTTLKYMPQAYQVREEHDPVGIDGKVDHNPTMPWLDHSGVIGETYKYISSANNKAYYHVSPSMGVQDEDIEMPSFNCITSKNITRADVGEIATENSPIQPVAYKIVGDEMEVTFKKTTTEFIGSKGEAHGQGKSETFYMASLKAPIAEKNWTDAEKEAGEEVAVNSEYSRIEELIKYPYLVNTKTDFTKPMTSDFADETQLDANGESFFVHYHDSVCLYESEATELVDHLVGFDKTIDLKKYVTVCVTDEENAHGNGNTHADHELFSQYKDYGLAFRFYLATAPYITLGGAEGNSNKTDQQKFAEIDSPENGLMTSRVYDIDGGSATAVGREPIVRVELRDTVNNKLIGQRYIKFKWVKEAEQRPIEVTYADTLYVCGNYNGYIGTQKMNEDIYDKAKDGGMTKQEFHAVYTDGGFDANAGEGDGVVALIKNTEPGVDSYNILWTLTHRDIVEKYGDWNTPSRLEFEKTFYWNDPTKAYPTLKITLKRVIYKPEFGNYGYDGRYWRTSSNYTIFNVNPIVYNTVENNPAWNDNPDHKNNPTVNIYTDLLNGFLDKNGQMPKGGAGHVLWYTDNGSPRIDYVDTYDNWGVKYVFDLEKLTNGTNPDGDRYVFPYFNGTTTVDMTATLSPDHTKLYINGELAATIENALVNNCGDTSNPRYGAYTYNIKLEEADPDADPYGDATGTVYEGASVADPTEAAKALVGKYVPIKLIADICDDDETHAAAHTVDIKEYDAFIIDPLTIKHGDTDDFTDATVDGSTVDVKGAFTYTCWNADANGEYYTASISVGATSLQRELWRFYECTPGEWMTDHATTNLAMDANGNLVPTAGVTNGPLPSNTTVVYDPATETVTYYNHSGTPVNWDYTIYIPVKFGYKWKTMTETFEIQVKSNAGTPTKGL